MNREANEKETIITDLGRKECTNYMNLVAKKVIKPIMFLDEEQDSIIDFPMEFSSLINFNILKSLNLDSYIKSKAQGQIVYSLSNLNFENRSIIAEQVYNFIINQLYILLSDMNFDYVANSIFDNDNYEYKFIFNKFAGLYRDDCYNNKALKDFIKNFYQFNNLYSCYRDSKEELEWTVNHTKISGMQLAQIIINSICLLLENNYVARVDYIDFKSIFNKNNLEKNTNFPPELRGIIKDYYYENISSIEIINSIKNYMRGSYRILLEKTAPMITDLCVNTLLTSEVTLFYLFNDMKECITRSIEKDYNNPYTVCDKEEC